MAGTSEGARKAVETKRKKYGNTFFATNGHKGGVARNQSDKKFNPFEDKEYAKLMAKKAKAYRWPDNDKPDEKSDEQ